MRRVRRVVIVDFADIAGDVQADALLLELDRVCRDVEADPGASALLLCGNWALPEHKVLLINEGLSTTWLDTTTQATPWDDPQEPLSRCRKPVIAAVGGEASGLGAMLLLACDLRIASRKACFRFTPTDRYATVGGWMAERLVRAVGVGMALDWCLTRSAISAEDARAAGFLAALHPTEKLDERALELALEVIGESDPRPADAMRVGPWGERRSDIWQGARPAPWDT